MFELTIVLICVAIALSVVSVCVCLFYTVGRKQRINKLVNEEVVRSELAIMESERATSSKKARAFSTTIKRNYACVSVTVNSGDKYSDRKQTRSFCDNLTLQRLEKINSMETI